MSAFVHAQSIKTVHAGGVGVKKWQNSVHVVIECPLSQDRLIFCAKKVKIKELLLDQSNLRSTVKLKPFEILALYNGDLWVPQPETSIALMAIDVPPFTLCCDYRKVASSNTSRLEAHAGFFRLLMKGIFDPYVL